MNKLDQDYQNLLGLILGTGEFKEDRTGTGCISIFGEQIRHDMSNGFPLLTTKKMAIKTMVTELKWFLKGDTNIKYLVDSNCNIWNGDAYKNFQNNHNNPVPLTQKEFIEYIKTDKEFAEKWGELGPIYGKQWREWESEYEIKGYVDQIANLISELKTNPNSRRLIVNAWNVGELDQMILPPCHYGFQCYTTELSTEERYDIWFKNNYETGMEHYFQSDNLPDFEDSYYEPTPKRKLSLMWNQRSVDTFLGLPFNISSYGLLLLLLCEETGYKPGELIGNLGDTHLYSNHVEQAKEQISRESYKLPTIKLSNVDILNGEFDYEIMDYKFHPTIKASLSN